MKRQLYSRSVSPPTAKANLPHTATLNGVLTRESVVTVVLGVRNVVPVPSSATFRPRSGFRNIPNVPLIPLGARRARWVAAPRPAGRAPLASPVSGAISVTCPAARPLAPVRAVATLGPRTAAEPVAPVRPLGRRPALAVRCPVVEPPPGPLEPLTVREPAGRPLAPPA